MYEDRALSAFSRADLGLLGEGDSADCGARLFQGKRPAASARCIRDPRTMRMKKSTAIGLFSLGTLSVIVGMWLRLSGWMVILGAGAALFSLSDFLRGLASDRYRRAIEGALDDLDVISGGLRIIGRDAEIVDWRRADLPTEPGPMEIEQLCRQRRGNGSSIASCFWFSSDCQ